MSISSTVPAKSLYHQVYLARVQAAINACETVASLTHSGEKGRIREILLASLFKPLLPSDLGVGTGFVISSDRQVSSQQDILLYDKSILPPALFDESTGFFPIESVLYSIEVKSTITYAELASSHDNAKRLAQMPVVGPSGLPQQNGPRPKCVVLALRSDLVDGGKSEAARYAEIRGTDQPYISGLCVVNRCYWWLYNGAFTPWIEKHRYAEIMGFIGGILNDIPGMYTARRSTRPAIGNYLIDMGADLDALLMHLSGIESSVQSEVLAPSPSAESLRELRQALDALSAQIATTFRNYTTDGSPMGELQTLTQRSIEALTEKVDARIQAIAPESRV